MEVRHGDWSASIRPPKPQRSFHGRQKIGTTIALTRRFIVRHVIGVATRGLSSLTLPFYAVATMHEKELSPRQQSVDAAPLCLSNFLFLASASRGHHLIVESGGVRCRFSVAIGPAIREDSIEVGCQTVLLPMSL